jgi:hypothetical protein
LDAIHVRHLEVGQKQVDLVRMFPRTIQCLRSITRRDYMELMLAKQLCQ